MTDAAQPAPLVERDVTIPLVAEELTVGARTVEVGRVRVRTEVDERMATARGDLHDVDIEVTRVPVGRVVDTVPAIREEGDVLIVPVVNEEIVVTKRLILREEVRVTRRTVARPFEQTVTLRSTRAVVEREDLSNPDPQGD